MQAIQLGPDLLFAGIVLARRALDVFNDLLAKRFCLSHRPLLGGDDGQQTLSWQMTLFGPIR